MTKREKADRLYKIFKRRFDEMKDDIVLGSAKNRIFLINEKIEEYMEKMHPHARMMHQETLVYLINEQVVDAIAVISPVHEKKVIVLEVEYANKILVLGLP